MTYLINEIAKLSGVSTRTLRYYDQIGLIKPAKILDNGYRVYDETQVDLLQQILFYRELNFELTDIKRIMSTKDYSRMNALNEHLEALEKEAKRINLLINNVKTTISTLEGKTRMKDTEKFMGFKETKVKENEAKYGEEMRKKYGNEIIDNANSKTLGLSIEEWNKLDELEQSILKSLKDAMNKNDVSCEEAKELTKLHATWLQSKWPDGVYSKEMHLSLAEGYLADERFIAYYDRVGVNATKFLVAAIKANL